MYGTDRIELHNGLQEPGGVREKGKVTHTLDGEDPTQHIDFLPCSSLPSLSNPFSPPSPLRWNFEEMAPPSSSGTALE
jgi:hypothetical protein